MSVGLLAALACLTAEPHIWCLTGPCSVLTWDVEPAAITDLPCSWNDPFAASGTPTSTAQNDLDHAALGRGWTHFTGGYLVQMDYTGHLDVVRVRSALVWDATGKCHRIGNPQLPVTSTAASADFSADFSARAAPRLAGPLIPAWDGATHVRKVEALREHIARGDCYQVNLTLPFTGTLQQGDDLAVAMALFTQSPGPFSAFIRRPGRPTVISHSPENFLAVQRAQLLSCPIKGTRRPGFRDELLTAEKDRAELAMIVDLVRNDVGRVSVPGSVQVPQPARILDLTYVHHLVAEVAAQVRPHTSWSDLLAATFPAGSITGAPKRKAMELIAAYEDAPRGAYCGTFGWVGAQTAQLAVAIRTLTVAASQVTLHAGSGIVADSDGAAEWDEVRAKASAMAGALGGVV